MIIHTAIPHLIAIPIVTPQHQIVQMMTLSFVVDALLININIALVVNSHVLQDLYALMDVGTTVEQPIQAVNNMIYFYKGDKLWLLK
jgi:hypothetical protein